MLKLAFGKENMSRTATSDLFSKFKSGITLINNVKFSICTSMSQGSYKNKYLTIHDLAN
jgi:hypothetical protein